MVQLLEKSMSEIEFKEIKNDFAQEESEKDVDNANGDLNPRYFEEAKYPKKAKLKLWAKYGDYLLR